MSQDLSGISLTSYLGVTEEADKPDNSDFSDDSFEDSFDDGFGEDSFEDSIEDLEESPRLNGLAHPTNYEIKVLPTVPDSKQLLDMERPKPVPQLDEFPVSEQSDESVGSPTPPISLIHSERKIQERIQQKATNSMENTESIERSTNTFVTVEKGNESVEFQIPKPPIHPPKHPLPINNHTEVKIMSENKAESTNKDGIKPPVLPKRDDKDIQRRRRLRMSIDMTTDMIIETKEKLKRLQEEQERQHNLIVNHNNPRIPHNKNKNSPSPLRKRKNQTRTKNPTFGRKPFKKNAVIKRGREKELKNVQKQMKQESRLQSKLVSKERSPIRVPISGYLSRTHKTQKQQEQQHQRPHQQRNNSNLPSRLESPFALESLPSDTPKKIPITHDIENEDDMVGTLKKSFLPPTNTSQNDNSSSNNNNNNHRINNNNPNRSRKPYHPTPHPARALPRSKYHSNNNNNNNNHSILEGDINESIEYRSSLEPYNSGRSDELDSYRHNNNKSNLNHQLQQQQQHQHKKGPLVKQSSLKSIQKRKRLHVPLAGSSSAPNLNTTNKLKMAYGSGQSGAPSKIRRALKHRNKLPIFQSPTSKNRRMRNVKPRVDSNNTPKKTNPQIVPKSQKNVPNNQRKQAFIAKNSQNNNQKRYNKTPAGVREVENVVNLLYGVLPPESLTGRSTKQNITAEDYTSNNNSSSSNNRKESMNNEILKLVAMKLSDLGAEEVERLVNGAELICKTFKKT
eukprot:TRINITY_DN330_c0_g1_i4.p1 TRINITY_DN330_c0_g1~~TRINITY_DN330_c0_g1_i4.p1  ORF type:complete len:736 (+),score=198.49 TRINITY_DN330_c0_g1_i4:94-2301(+)